MNSTRDHNSFNPSTNGRPDADQWPEYLQGDVYHEPPPNTMQHRGRRGTQCNTENTENTENTDDTFPQRNLRSLCSAAPSALSAPSVLHDYGTALFSFARQLKAEPHLADADARDLRPLVEKWVRDTGPMIGKPVEEVLIDFLQAFDRVKFPKGTGPLSDALARAKANPFPEVAQRYQQPQLQLLVALCCELQRSAGDEPFFLACRTAGQLIEVDHKTAWRWLFLLCKEKVLHLVSTGSKASKRASEYLYLEQGVNQ